MTKSWHPVQVARRLEEAAGYLELGLPERALERLQGVSHPEFGPAIAFMRAWALAAQGEHGKALGLFRQVAQQLPAPWNRPAWHAVARCLEATGQTVAAANALACARGANQGAVKIKLVLVRKRRPRNGKPSSGPSESSNSKP